MMQELMTPSIRRVCLLGLLYFLGAELGHLLSFDEKGFATFWPPSGILLGFLVLTERREWPKLLLAALGANLISDYVHGKPPPISLVFWCGNALESLAGALLVQRWSRLSASVDLSLRTLVTLVALPGLMCTMISATIGTATLFFASYADDHLAVWLIWWIADFLGITLFAPLILTLRTRHRPRPRSRLASLETALCLFFLVVTTLAIFDDQWHTPPKDIFHLPFLTFPALLWLAVRTTTRATAFGLAAMSTLVVWFTVNGSGPFGAGVNEVVHRVILVQTYVGIASLSFLALSCLISERQKALLDMAEKARSLELANAELEQFAYVASHDLQEPLRAVASYVGLIEKRYGHALDENGRTYLHHAVDGARRMQEFINDLLVYAGVQKEGQKTDVDLNRIMEDVLRDLDAQIGAAKAEVRYGALPVVSGYPTLLKQTLQNLVSNGIKFNKDGVPRVRVEAEAMAGGTVVSVTDNGIGIEPRHAERLFVIFRRLHTRAEFPGTGIGLAICKKAVETHGGRIWLEPSNGGGTVFRFTLPAK